MTDTLPDPPELDPSVLASSGFGRARKGFDPTEVNHALGRAADALRVWELRDRQLRARIEDLELRVAESHELDEHRIATVLGEETARIVTAAKDAAGEIRSKAEEQAARLLRETEESATASADALKSEATELRDEAARLQAEAQEEAERTRTEAASAADALLVDARLRHDELLAEAETVLDVRTREAEAVASGLVETAAAELSAAEVEAAGIRIAAEVDANEERDRAREDGRSMVAEAKALRERMLADLAERRKTARRQIEGARGGRDRIIEVLRAAGAEVASTIDGLEDIDAEIQQAADAAALQVDDDIDAVVAELVAELGDPATEEPAGEPTEVVADLLEAEVRAVSDSVVSDSAESVAEESVTIEDAVAAAEDESLAVEVEVLETDRLEVTTDDDGEPELVAEHVETVHTVEVLETDDGVEVVETVETVVERTEIDLGDGEPADTAAEPEPEDEDSARVIGMFAGSTSPAEPEVDVIDDEDLLEGEDDLLEDDEDEDAASSSDAEDPGATVHDLFARIRAEGLDEADEADGTDGTDPEEDATVDVRGAEAEVTLTSGEPGPGDGAGGAATSGEATASGGVAVVTEEDSISALLDRRDQVLVPIEKQLSRALRRLASDEQNEVLDQLRRIKRGRPDVAAVLPDAEVTRERFTEALASDFDAAVTAGSEFWGEVAGAATDSLFGEDSRVRDALDAGVGSFLAVHRAHLERTFAEADEAGLDVADLGDRIRATYRDWRSTSLAELAGDLAATGFAQGERLAAGPGTPWRWVVDNGGLPCADGEDNALAGPVPCEEPFPTGDLTPPAHPGCRCILLPAHR